MGVQPPGTCGGYVCREHVAALHMGVSDEVQDGFSMLVLSIVVGLVPELDGRLLGCAGSSIVVCRVPGLWHIHLI